MIEKKLIDETIDLCVLISNGIKDGSMNIKNYKTTVKPFIDKFEEKYNKKSPNLIFKRELDLIKKENNLVIDIDSSGKFSFHTRKLNTHVWAPLYSSKDGYKNSIQLYISVWEGGIKFGICYGDNISKANTSDSKFLKIIQNNQSIFEKLYSIISKNPNINFYNGEEEKKVISGANLGSLWSNKSAVLGKFKKDEIPDNAGEIIHKVLTQLAEVFNEIVLATKSGENIVNEPNSKMDKPIKENSKNIKHPLNQILYGPPGTGKTYNTINKALEIIGKDENEKELIEEEIERLDRLGSEGRKRLKAIFDYHINTTGQIVFTTFHQSMSYEDFVEGIKPQEPKEVGGLISYKVEDGIFKRICSEARKINKSVIKIEDDEEELTQDVFQQYYEAFTSKLPSQSESNSNYTLLTPKSKKTFKLFKNSANSIIVKAGIEEVSMCISSNELTKVFFENKKPIYKSYEKTLIDKILENTDYEKISINNSSKPYVLIIDEINRGNVSAIFGELITLIEKDKRIGGAEELKVILPYSKNEEDKFGVPSNLYIIGTMNTADRSVEALDSALRRRFNFEEMPPKPGILKSNGKLEDNFEVDLEDLLTTINERIEILLDRDHLIGHSYLMGVKNEKTLKEAFSKQIIPLLKEYFYGDYGKISLVLGEGFCKGEKTKNLKTTFAAVSHYDTDAFEETYTYRIIDNFNTYEAIKTLLNKHNSNSPNSDK